MLNSRAISLTLALALVLSGALVGCTSTMPDGAAPTTTMGTMGTPAIFTGDAPPVLFVGTPQQIIGAERPDIVLDGWN